MNLSIVHRQELAANQAQLAQFRESWGTFVVQDIIRQATEALDALLHKDSLREIDPSRPGVDREVAAEARRSLQYRLARDAAHFEGIEIMDDFLRREPTDSVSDVLGSMTGLVSSAVGRAVQAWYDHTHLRQSLSDTTAETTYKLWKGAPEANGDGKPRENDHMPQLQAIVERAYPSTTRAFFEEVRDAEYAPLGQDDVKDVLAMYRRRLLSEQMLALLVSSWETDEIEQQKKISAFAKDLQKGVFIHDPKDGEFEAMVRGEQDDAKGLRFWGRVLRSSDDGRLLAYATSLRARHGSKHMAHRRKTVKDYIRKGVAGDKRHPMKYGVGLEKIRDELLHDAEHVDLFQDIQAAVPFAADRMGALMFQDMNESNPALNHVLAYRLYDLDMDPNLLLYHRMRTHSAGRDLTDNPRSRRKFVDDWGFTPVAHDYNPAAEGSPRTVPGVESTMRLNPHWEVMHGRINRIVSLSRKHWRRIQLMHGDLSHDNAPKTHI